MNSKGAKYPIGLHKNREKIRGLKWAYEPKQLRFFIGRFEPA